MNPHLAQLIGLIQTANLVLHLQSSVVPHDESQIGSWSVPYQRPAE